MYCIDLRFFFVFLGAMDIMKGTLATELLLQGAILVKGTYNCKLYWKKGDSFSASAEFGMIFAKNVQTMQLAQGVCIVSALLVLNPFKCKHACS